MRWTDIYDIAIALETKYPTIDIVHINFVKLKDMVLSLDGFGDEQNRSNEKVLEAIQSAWLEEKE